MKIVFLTHDSNCIGGAQLCLVDLIKGIKMQHPTAELYLLLGGYGDMIEACEPYISGYKVVKMKRWWLYPKKQHGPDLIKRAKYLLRLAKARNKIIDYLRQIKPEYAVTNSIVVPQLAVACEKLGIPHTWLLHEMPVLTWGNYRFVYSNKTTFDKIGNLSSHILVTSDFAKQHYCKLITNNAKIDSIAQSVEVPVRPQDTHDRYTIIIAGSIEPTKGQLELLHAMAKLKERGVDAFCYLVGRHNAHYVAQCKEYIASHNLTDNVEFAAFTKDIYSYYYRSDVLVNCSVMEAFGRVAVEAQLCGLPVVLADVGANLERVTDGVNGFIYKRGDIEDLADKLEYLSNKEHRRAFSEKLELLHLEKHTISAFANNFLRLITAE